MLYEYILIWCGVWAIATAIVADRRGHSGGALVLWIVLGAVLGILGLLLALASSGSGGDGHRAFRLSR